MDKAIYEIEDGQGRLIHVYSVDEAWQSACFVDEDIKYEPVFGYFRAFHHIFDLNPGIRDILMIGGGTYSYPEYVISVKPDVCCDVVEMDDETEDIARMYFHLDEFEKEYPGRMTLIFMEGMDYLMTTDKKYDAIINDAYVGPEPYLNFSMELIRKHMKEGGIYAVNLALKSNESPEAEISRLREVFAEITTFREDCEFNSEKNYNLVVCAR